MSVSIAVPDDQQVLFTIVLWLSATLAVLIVYVVVLVPCLPRLFVLRPVQVGTKNVRWSRLVMDAWSMSPEEWIQTCGLDTYFTLRTIALCVRCALLMSLVDSIVLLPVYQTQVRPSECDVFCSSSTISSDDDYFAECVCGQIDQCSLATIPRTALTLWLPVVTMFVTSMGILAMLTSEYRQVTRLRKKGMNRKLLYTAVVERDVLPSFLPTTSSSHVIRPMSSDDAPPIPDTSDLIEPIPGHREPAENGETYGSLYRQGRQVERGEDVRINPKFDKGVIAAKFEQLFPEKIHDVQLISASDLSAIKSLESIATERFHVLVLLENALEEQSRLTNQDDLIFTWQHNKWRLNCNKPLEERRAKIAKQVDGLQYELSRLNKTFAQAKQEFIAQLHHSGAPGGRELAFVTFTSAPWSKVACRVDVDHDMHVRPAPAPNDVRWDSLFHRAQAGPALGSARTILSRTLFFVILVFWGTITSAVASVASAEALGVLFPRFNEWLSANPGTIIWLNRFLALIYSLLLNLAYPLVAWTVQLETFRLSQTELDSAIMTRFTIFLVIQVFVFYSIAGSVFKSIVDIATEPARIVGTLSSTIPENASFFLSFIAFNTFSTALGLTRVNSMLFHLLRAMYSGFCSFCLRKPRTSSQRQRNYQACGCCGDMYVPNSMGIAKTNSNIMLAMFVAICYAVIQPIVNLLALAFFIVSWICFAIQARTTTWQRVEGEGAFWPRIFGSVVLALVTAHLTLVGVLFTKEAYAAAAFTLVACFIVTLVVASLIDAHHRKRFDSMSLVQLTALDEPLLSRERYRPTAQVISEPYVRYNHLVGRIPIEASFDEEQAVICCYKYVHPVLLERDELRPGDTLIDNASERTRESHASDQP